MEFKAASLVSHEGLSCFKGITMLKRKQYYTSLTYVGHYKYTYSHKLLYIINMNKHNRVDYIKREMLEDKDSSLNNLILLTIRIV